MLALIVAAALGGPEKIDVQMLVGKWELAEEFGGLTIRVEFTKGGKMVDTVDGHGGLKIEGVSEYKIDGTKIVVTADGKAETMTVAKLTKDELVLRFKKGSAAYKRVK